MRNLVKIKSFFYIVHKLNKFHKSRYSVLMYSSIKQGQEADVEYKHVWNIARSKVKSARLNSFKTEINKLIYLFDFNTKCSFVFCGQK